MLWGADRGAGAEGETCGAAMDGASLDDKVAALVLDNNTHAAGPGEGDTTDARRGGFERAHRTLRRRADPVVRHDVGANDDRVDAAHADYLHLCSFR